MNELDRVKIVIQHLISSGLSDSQKGIGSLLGYTNESSFSQIINGKVKTPKNFINKLKSITPNLNEDWLITGKGNMFLGDDKEELHIHNECSKGVPYYNIDITLGMLETFETVEVAEYYVDYKPFNDCTAYLPVYGDSMFPRFKNGEVIAVKQIANFDVILWGEAYLIITNPNANSLKTVKLLFQHPDEAKVILRASNPSYAGDTVISKEDILAIYSVRGKISRDFI